MTRNIFIKLFHCFMETFPLKLEITISLNSDGVFDFCKFWFSLYTCSHFFCQHEEINSRFQSLRLTLDLVDINSRLAKVDQKTFELYLVLEAATEVSEALKLNKFSTNLVFSYKKLNFSCTTVSFVATKSSFIRYWRYTESISRKGLIYCKECFYFSNFGIFLQPNQRYPCKLFFLIF